MPQSALPADPLEMSSPVDGVVGFEVAIQTVLKSVFSMGLWSPSAVDKSLSLEDYSNPKPKALNERIGAINSTALTFVASRRAAANKSSPKRKPSTLSPKRAATALTQPRLCRGPCPTKLQGRKPAETAASFRTQSGRPRYVGLEMLEVLLTARKAMMHTIVMMAAKDDGEDENYVDCGVLPLELASSTHLTPAEDA